jgi:hypothetical protein
MLKDERLQKAFEIQKEAGWTFYHEREFMENLLQTRFNFLLAVYALFLNAFVQIKNNNFLLKLGVLCIGLVVIIIMGFTVYRIYTKVMILLNILRRLGDDHVFPLVDEIIKDREFSHSGVNHLIGWVVPLLLVLSFIAGIILVCLNVL